MNYVKLSTGAKMPMLGLGVFKIDENEGKKAIHAALDAGYRSIDTAAAYHNERLVGEVICESGIAREELFITTKLANPAQREGEQLAAFEESMRGLALEYVDLYLIHWPVPEKFVESWLVLEKIFKSGRAKAIGVSNFQPHHIAEIKKVWSVVPAVNQIEIHPRLTQKNLIDACRAENILPQSWSPLGGGKDFDFKEKLFANETLSSIAKKYNKTSAQIILRWNIDCDIIAIPKSVTHSRIRENINIFDFELTREEISAIDKLNENHRTGPDPDNFHNFF
jgi:diketogulonate reductase-like aldo/keto reductase